MKVAVVGIQDFAFGKTNLEDERLDKLQEIFKARKVTLIQIEFVPVDAIKDAEAVVTNSDGKLELILSDLDYVQTRLSTTLALEEQQLFSKAKEILEKEDFLSGHLSPEELKKLKGFPLMTILPAVVLSPEQIEDIEGALAQIYAASGRICFFTAGEREARAWSIRKGTTAYEAAGCIHSDIQQGFIRAEVASYKDVIEAGHYNQVKNQGKVRLENKEYVISDGDIILFRFNK